MEVTLEERELFILISYLPKKKREAFIKNYYRMLEEQGIISKEEANEED